VIRQTRKNKPFEIHAWVILPEHIHAIWMLPTDDDDYSGRWRLIKSRFSYQVDLTHNAKGEYFIWQRRSRIGCANAHALGS
jgi:putative transposase